MPLLHTLLLLLYNTVFVYTFTLPGIGNGKSTSVIMQANKYYC